MRGFFNECDKVSLTVGSPCLIYAYEGGSAHEGYWFGEVTDCGEHESTPGFKNHFIVARITGGRFRIDQNGKPVMSDERRGEVPFGSHEIMPNTKTHRELVARILRAQSALAEASHKIDIVKQLHTGVINSLIKAGTIILQKDIPKKS